eukprot:CAMPEP_0114990396 /NCGR_PEP_ID=MMETSP0216-20121206/10774_1 /TAXON_ID=223996 /ORGANISM="Protocruzia adherens, Strain Boccale" /LENGTH=505 /DNA_ID=CAMNT_0002353569 /DNA_START=35 /DNA_END=1549 /DNA_ORIENTATION=+
MAIRMTGRRVRRRRDFQLVSMALAGLVTLVSAQNYPPSAVDPNGAGVIVYFFGMLYCFFGLSIVCDEYFVPALDVIVERFKISNDVAGATFMAAGGSAPELFTSFIGVFIAKSNVGFGTIIGSAVFNVLFVIGMCALFAPGVLKLTSWPLARDSCFYAIDLVLLAVFFIDERIEWWEALILICMYFMYVLFMKYNQKIERFFKGLPSDEDDTEDIDPNWAIRSKVRRRHTLTSLKAQAHKMTFSVGILDLMMNHRKKDLEKTPDTNNARFRSAVNTVMTMIKEKHKAERKKRSDLIDSDGNINEEAIHMFEPGEDEDFVANVDDGDEDEGTSLAIPDGCLNKALYFFLLPITHSLYFTVPDVRHKGKQGLYPVTFIFSILWIGFWSYFMVWWAEVAGEALGISALIMGLTILAAGTSVPDLLTSVLVTKKGEGDMAVSSSIGSNIFDVTVGLPTPWFFATLIFGEPMDVGSDGILISILVLFGMLFSIILIIAAYGWKLKRSMSW